MPSKDLLKVLNYYNKPFLKQTLLYPNITEEAINFVTNDFSEFTSMNEIPLIFCQGSTEQYEVRWFLLTNKYLYYRIAAFPPIITALDCIAVNTIMSLKIRFKWMVVFLEINNKVLGTLVISSVREILLLKKIIKAVLDHIDTSEVETESLPNSLTRINYFPKSEWHCLQNASLFSLVDNYFSKHNQGGRLWGFCDFAANPFIKQEKIEMARQEYADYNPHEEIPILFVENPTKNPSGIVITNKCLYYNLTPSPFKKWGKGKQSLKNITSFEVKPRFFGWIYINGKRIGMTNNLNIFDKKCAKVFKDIVNLIIKELETHRDPR